LKSEAEQATVGAGVAGAGVFLFSAATQLKVKPAKRKINTPHNLQISMCFWADICMAFIL
jgi:hypothetical protein